MSYQVLARKWRPPDFSSVIGQEPIVTALRNALTEDRIAQAYLFSGIRGVGKTTAARVLAKALNCERGPAPDPCNECTSCREIAGGGDLDVLEVDAATYSKVEQVRELTESLRYGPARDRYKVVVIDEIHRLSRQAFDALLKIIEEPPPHLVFIFATTEIDAVPATILSRCQEFHFRRVPSETVAGLLRTMAEAESIDVGDAALRLIARAGEGSVRDSVALLDQLATFGGGTIQDEDAMRLLGGMDTALFAEVLQAILAGDRATLASAVRRVEDEGWDPRNVFAQFLAYCRDALHLAIGGDAATVDLPEEEAARLREHVTGAGFESLIRLLQQLLASEETVRRSDASALALEIAWLRAAELPRLTLVEDLLAGRTPAASPTGAPETPRAPAAARTAPESEGSTQTPAPAPTAPAATPRTASRPEPSPGGGTAATEQGFLERMTDHKAALAGHLGQAERLDFEDGVLHVVIASDDTILPARLEKPHNRELIDRVVQEVFGADATWKTVRGSASIAPHTPQPTDEPPPEQEVKDNPTVQTVLEIFDGTVEQVDESEES